MLLKKPKKTFRDQTAQSFLKSARLVDGQLLVTDWQGTIYRAQRSPSGQELALADVTVGFGALLSLDAWGAAELAWWEAAIDALSPAQELWLVVDEEGVVVGHLLDPAHAANPERAYAFRINNAARRPVPALGSYWAPAPVPERPIRTRGRSARSAE